MAQEKDRVLRALFFTAAALLEPQVAAASVEPQLFAVALELGCPVVELDSEDGSDLSREDWEDFVASYECAWSEPVVLEGSELVVALEVSEPPVELESSPCDVVVLGRGSRGFRGSHQNH